ncbi:MAG: hypothetical protein GY844_26350 [Bradyrhizobium sp.]|uniref:hypothetical protein n=1 Tax=Sphingomonas sp. VL_57B TaxID=3144220 RepID=UPI0031F5C4A6|nr:hypothetical protein [Bradyrhizobium sp.]
MTLQLARADNRPRIHLWPLSGAWHWAFGPTAARYPAPTAGAGVDEALASLEGRARAGVVVIIEPPT